MQALTRRAKARDGSETVSSPRRDSEATEVVDLRERENRPVEAVFDALDDHPAGEGLIVIASAAPVPLYDRLDERGWSYEAVRSEADEWRIRITPDGDGRSGERLRRPRRRRHEQP